MTNLLKSTFLGLGILTAVAATASAQSVSSLPPSGDVASQTPITQPYGSTQSFYPKPGGSAVWKEEHYQPPADYETNKAVHPYSTSIGPKAGSHSSGPEQHYQASGNDTPAQHPYTAPGMGPRPN